MPSDGTFDQVRPVLDYTKWPSAYSLDLSAATDRLPLSIQIRLLTLLYGEEFALNWARLLVDRDYSAYHSKYTNGREITVRYAVGQPMGALSSWAMLALTHHYIIHSAAWSTGIIPLGALYQNYAILGDDIVIGDQVVKDRYLLILDALGVEVGLHKSVLSPNGIGLEFAKRTFYKGVDVSPVPVREFLDSLLGLPSAIAFARKYNLSLAGLVKSLGFGYKVLGGLTKHIGLQSSKIRALTMAYYTPDPISNPRETEAWLNKGNPLFEGDPVPVTLFMKEVISRVQKIVSRSYTFNVASHVTQECKSIRRVFWSRFGVPYLESIVPEDNIGGIVPSYARPEYWWSGVEGPQTQTVPPNIFNRIESDLRDLDLLMTNLLTNIIGPQVRSTRDDLDKVRSDMTRLGHTHVQLAKAYLYCLQALNGVANLNVVTVFERAKDDNVPRLLIESVKL